MLLKQFHNRRMSMKKVVQPFMMLVLPIVILLLGFVPIKGYATLTDEEIQDKLTQKYEQNADALLLMIKQHQFEKVDSFFGHVVKQDYITRDGIRYLTAVLGHWFFKSERVAPFPLHILKDLNVWIGQHQNSAIAYIIRGSFYISYAWEARGGGWAKNVKAEAWTKFYERLNYAQTDLDKAHELDPQNPHAARQIMKFNQVISNSSQKGELLFEQIIGRAPTFYFAYRSKLENLMPKWGGSWEALFQFARETEKNAPPRTLLPFILVKAHEEAAARSGNKKEYYSDLATWNDISRVYKRILGDFPDSERLKTEFGNVAYDAGKIELAKSYWMSAADADPYCLKTFQAVISMHEKEKQFELTEYYAMTLVGLYPQYAKGHSWLGYALLKQERYEEAIDSYSNAIQYNNKKARYWNNRGICNNKLQNYEDAIEDCTKAIELDDNYRWAYKQRAYANKKLGNTKASKSDYRKYEKLKQK